MGKVFVFLVKSNKGPFYLVRIKTFLAFMQYLSRFIYFYEHFLSFSSTYHLWEDLVVLKRTKKKMFSRPLTPYTSGNLYVLGHYSDPLRMDGT